MKGPRKLIEYHMTSFENGTQNVTLVIQKETVWIERETFQVLGLLQKV